MEQKREKEIVESAVEILKRHLQPAKIILFGSRGKKQNGKHADFDFAVKAKKPDISKQREILEELSKVAGLYKIDLVYLDSVDREFKEIILQTGQVLYG